MYLQSSGAFATEVRTHQIVENDTNCDRTSNLYFWMSLLLFVTGFVLTLVILDENEFGPLAKFWLIGPVFLCLAFIIAIKTLLYLRQKTLTAIFNQTQFAQEPTDDNADWYGLECPTYEASELPNDSLPSPPPTYQEALRSAPEFKFARPVK